MMIGNVQKRHAVLPVTFRPPGMAPFPLACDIDTGFTGELTIPVTEVERMGIEVAGVWNVTLADDSPLRVPYYLIPVLWNGQEREVRALATGSIPLIGMGLLEGHELNIQAIEGGLVSVDAL